MFFTTEAMLIVRQLLTDFADRLARREARVRLPQLLNDLLLRVLLALHNLSISRPDSRR